MLFIIVDKARGWGGHTEGCQCSERLRAKVGGGARLAHTRQWSGKVYIGVFYESVHVCVVKCRAGIRLIDSFPLSVTP